MDVQGIATVLPVDDVAEAARLWEALLGVKPTFVDAPRWAQFDVGGRRIALAGTDRTSDKAGLMIKVGDLAAARAAFADAGVPIGEVEEGPHELRCTGAGPGGWPVTLYTPKPK